MTKKKADAAAPDDDVHTGEQTPEREMVTHIKHSCAPWK